MENQISIEPFLFQTAEQISQTFGVYCETAVYRIENGTNRILHICNRKVSRRNIGDTYEKLLETDDKDLADKVIQDFYEGVSTSNVYLYRTDAKLLKLTTIHYRQQNQAYAISIAFDDTVLSMAESALHSLNQPNLHQGKENNSEDKKLEEIFESCHMVVGTPIYMMGKTERIQMVRLLKDANAFSFQRSIPYVASRLRVSRYSIYNYLKELER